MLNKLVKLLSTIYVILLCVILPLYMEEGYYMLGEAKGRMYLLITEGFVALTFVFAILLSLLLKTKRPQWELWIKAFLLSGIVTFLFSTDKKTALLGLEGWRTGLLTCSLMILACYILSMGVIIDNYVLAAIFITPLFSFILGILGRFGINLIPIYGSNESFLATLGNINWYAGFLSIFVPVGVGLCYLQKLWSKEFFICGAYTLIGLIALLLQGADSGILIIIGAYAVLLFLSLSTRENFNKFLLQLSILGIAMEVVAVLMFFFGKSYNYESNYLITVCNQQIGLVALALAFFMYRISVLCDGIEVSWKERVFKRIFIGLAILLIISMIVLVLAGNLGYGFGNGRLFIWQISLEMFLNLSSWQKLFGVGQDCFFTYAYHNPRWAESLLNVLGGDRLTNAHCEPLTVLLERGLVGAITYYGFIGYSFGLIIKKERTRIICSLPIAAYLLNSLVSFSTTISTTYLFVIIGIGIFLTSDQELQ